MSDAVNHPPHYNQVPNVECIDVVEHFGFNIGNAIKYLWRADEKGTPIEDLRKASWYVIREIAKRGEEAGCGDMDSLRGENARLREDLDRTTEALNESQAVRTVADDAAGQEYQNRRSDVLMIAKALGLAATEQALSEGMPAFVAVTTSILPAIKALRDTEADLVPRIAKLEDEARVLGAQGRSIVNAISGGVLWDVLLADLDAMLLALGLPVTPRAMPVNPHTVVREQILPAIAVILRQADADQHNHREAIEEIKASLLYALRSTGRSGEIPPKTCFAILREELIPAIEDMQRRHRLMVHRLAQLEQERP